jgi:phage terminase small subunit
MTPRQQFFVLEYLLDLNATQAAIRAGYRPSGARVQGERLLRNPDIAQAIQAEMAERAKRCGITAERVLEEYARIAFADMRLLADWGPEGVQLKESAELPNDMAATIASIADIETRERSGLTVKTFDKRKALECLALILGLNIVEPTHGTAHRA